MPLSMCFTSVSSVTNVAIERFLRAQQVKSALNGWFSHAGMISDVEEDYTGENYCFY